MFTHLFKFFALALVHICLWNQWLPLQGSVLLPSLVAATDRNGVPSFVLPNSSLRRSTLSNIDVATPSTSVVFRDGRRHTVDLEASFTEEAKLQESGIGKFDLQESSDSVVPILNDLSDPGTIAILTDICDNLFRLSTTTVDKRDAALHTLLLLTHYSKNFLKHLTRPIDFDIFAVMLNRQQKTIWNKVGGYIRSKLQSSSLQRLQFEAKVLLLLTEMAKSNPSVARAMSLHKNLNTTLLNLYLEPDLKESGEPSTDEANATSQKESDEIAPILPSSSLDVSDISAGAGCYGYYPANPENGWDIKCLIRRLVYSYGGVRTQHVKECIDRLRANSSYDKQAQEELKKLMDISHLDDCGGCIEESNASSTDGEDMRLVWIPYCVSTSDELPSSLRRSLRINLGEDAASNVDLYYLPDLTIETQNPKHSGLLFGMLILCKVSGAEGGNSCIPYVRPHDSKATNSDTGGYMIVSNIQLEPTAYINAKVMLAKLLKQLNTTTELRIADDILKETWNLLNSNDKDMYDTFHKEIDFEHLAGLLHSTAIYAKADEVTIDSSIPESMFQRYSIFFNSFMGMVRGYMGKVLDNAYNLNWRNLLSLYETHDSASTSTQSVKIPTEEVEELVSSDDNRDIMETMVKAAVARSFQTTLFGILVDLAYMDGVRTLAKVHNCTPFLEALQSVVNNFPDAVPLSDVLDQDNKDYAPLFDRQALNGARTNVIRDAQKYIDARQIESYVGRPRDDFGNVVLTNDQWVNEGWTRQRVVPSSVIGPYFNGKKLLNMLGCHDQGRFTNRGLRILSLDGGGSRGVIAIEILADLERRLGKPLHEAFDLVVGTSCGAIIGACIALEKARAADIRRYFDDMLADVFKKDDVGNKTKRLYKHYAFYDEKTLYRYLKSVFDRSQLIDYSVDPHAPKFSCPTMQFDLDPFKPVIFRSYNYPPNINLVPNSPRVVHGTFAVETPDALRATTAAPTYFPLMEINGGLFADGAFYSNNPAAIALIEGMLLYPNVPIDCLVSIGTGDWNELFEEEPTEEMIADKNGTTENLTERQAYGELLMKEVILKSPHTPLKSPNHVGLGKILKHLIFAATNTEMVHLALNASMGNNYFRINPMMPLGGLDQVAPEVLKDLKDRTNAYLAGDEANELMQKITDVLLSNTYRNQAKEPSNK
ncbi:calcium-independent phospholipase a2-gamma [Babesia ovis]|uniref:Calcium-independent phospholipase a2-gamma n=1 Tax=Babesia ovis TaxID=5869 RepID=A0A9W5WTF6_BABOV|nr:calcium-independent phospholipase a2-gamma [Babesia ovis]